MVLPEKQNPPMATHEATIFLNNEGPVGQHLPSVPTHWWEGSPRPPARKISRRSKPRSRTKGAFLQSTRKASKHNMPDIDQRCLWVCGCMEADSVGNGVHNPTLGGRARQERVKSQMPTHWVGEWASKDKKKTIVYIGTAHWLPCTLHTAHRAKLHIGGGLVFGKAHAKRQNIASSA